MPPAGLTAGRLTGSVLHGFVTRQPGGGFAHSEPDQAASWDHAIDALDVAFGTGPPPHLTIDPI